ncbi:KAT8 regulatory NSL complex subunit 3 [Aplysia californica]|uniref:KAT8 regulatory NSL complex subunit 3 n=1 Tax=Aplysia californica TaxID=6500 RepID=A0ABM1VR92_APLCA|nr:KAT8 regulatory NSL complex subunit 3 [Aplysia californica]XP_005089510.1 KAT8 regulatory NSL complex subunit 3 [Aplysia californica]XP_035824934.1 KAT8 regulatory NSL complex subunit 3 [Aplysia californica]
MIKMEDNPVRFSPFSHRNPNEVSIVCIDHCYAKPWSTHPDASNAQPLRMLFMEKFPRPETRDKESTDTDIDVEGEDPVSTLPYDVNKARSQMVDCEKHAALLCPDQSEMRDDWEENIAAMRNSWSVLQNRVFAKVMRVLQADRLSRLSIQETKNEPILRRLQVDKAARRVRQAFANVGWDMTLILWIHNLFVENLRGQLFISYLEVLQTLKAKIPSLIDRLISGTTLKQDTLSSESLNALLKKSWDPVLASINQQKLKKLPENPLLLVIPSAPSFVSNPLSSKRHKFWYSQMAAMGKVINVIPINNSTSITIANCVENMIATVRSKLLEVKGHYPGRPIVLIGWHVGAVVACHVALMEIVQAVVCLGFPTMGVSGNRWDIEDQLYSCKTPTLFIVGQFANANSLDMLEEVREKLRVETGLVVVGGADDHLRMCRAKKRSCNVTQSMVDRCIMDEVFDFLGSILCQVNLQSEPMEEPEPVKKPRKRKQKDLATTVSSQTIGNIAKQSSLKVAKALALSSSSTSMLSGQVSVSAPGKIAKRASPKKKASKSGGDPAVFGKKPLLHLSFPSSPTTSVPGETTTTSTAAVSSVSEAAAIASAPELSNLLQSIRTSLSRSSNTVSTLSPAKVISTSAPTTNSAQSQTPASSVSGSASSSSAASGLSRFLASSALLRNTSLIKSAELNASLTNTVDTLNTSGPKQQPQILIRAGPTSEPFSIPLSFSMASKVLKTSSGVKLGDSLMGTSQIQHLLASSPVTSSTTTASSSSSAPSQLLQVSAGNTSSVSSSLTSSCTPPLSTFSSPVPSCSGSTSVSVSSSVHTSPGASIFNMGNDSVSMKESPPGNVPAPGTVSIDLGQIASSSSSNVLKLNSPPKVSLIPLSKQLQGLSGTSPERALLGGQVGSPEVPSGQSLLAQQQTPLESLTPSTHTTTSTARSLQLLPSTDSSKNLTPISHRGLTVTPTTQFLSTINSPSGLITLQLAPSRKDSAATVVTFTKDQTDVDAKQRILQQQILHLHDLASSTKQVDSTSVVSSFSKSESEKKLSQSTEQSPSRSSTSTLSTLVMTPASKASYSPGQIVLQYKSPSSHTLLSHGSSKPGSPQMVIATTSETLGQVTSLLESSPITLGDQRRGSSILSSPSQGGQDSPSPLSKAMSRLSAPSPSSSSAVSSTSSSPNPSQSSSGATRASKTTISSYTATSKPVLPTIASTRTRRIKTPKQYDL